MMLLNNAAVRNSQSPEVDNKNAGQVPQMNNNFITNSAKPYNGGLKPQTALS